jgi:hypothetical protein
MTSAPRWSLVGVYCRRSISTLPGSRPDLGNMAPCWKVESVPPAPWPDETAKAARMISCPSLAGSLANSRMRPFTRTLTSVWLSSTRICTSDAPRAAASATMRASDFCRSRSSVFQFAAAFRGAVFSYRCSMTPVPASRTSVMRRPSRRALSMTSFTSCEWRWPSLTRTVPFLKMAMIRFCSALRSRDVPGPVAKPQSAARSTMFSFPICTGKSFMTVRPACQSGVRRRSTVRSGLFKRTSNSLIARTSVPSASVSPTFTAAFRPPTETTAV